MKVNQVSFGFQPICFSCNVPNVVISFTVTYGMVSANMYYYTKVMSQLFLDAPLSPGDTATFRSLATMEEFWKVKMLQMLGSIEQFLSFLVENFNSTLLSFQWI